MLEWQKSTYFVEDKINTKVYKLMLQGHLFKAFPELREEELIFRHDNALSQTAKIVKNSLNNQGFEIHPWPSQNPDTNINENVWAFIKSKLKGHYGSKKELKEPITKIFHSIEVDHIKALY